MFDIGDLIIYSTQGICHIDDICERTYLGVTRNYYILHPLNNSNLKICSPVDNDNTSMLKLVNKVEAKEILESFKCPGVDWIESHDTRNKRYYKIIKQGDRKEIASVVNTLMRKKHITETSGRKFGEKDDKLLTLVQDTLFTELAMSLNTSLEAINEKVTGILKESAGREISVS